MGPSNSKGDGEGHGKSIICNFETLEALVYGGAILGGGGGGFLNEGLASAKLAIDMEQPRIIPVTELGPNDYVITVAAVGAPAAEHRFVKPMDFVKAVQKVADAFHHPISGIITNEMGARASANGLVQSAVLGLPIVDAPANGRAHPLGLMGSLGLHKKSQYTSVQAACGGDPDTGRHVELVATGELSRCAVLVREASIQAGGVVAVARNPVQASWLIDHAAVGAMEFAITLGRIYLEALKKNNRESIALISAHLGGEMVAKSKVVTVELTTKNGLDVGRMKLDSGHELTFCNEYLSVVIDNQRLYTFPDLITTIQTGNNLPVNTAEVTRGMELSVVAAKKDKLMLGDGMNDPDLFKILEETVGLPLLKYVFDADIT